MVVKTITITEVAYQRLNGRKLPNESFSEVILRVVPKSITAGDLLGILPGTEKELKEELNAIKQRRIKMSKEMDERMKRYASI